MRSVTIYQRSPQWARPIAGYSDTIGAGTQWLLDNVPYYVEWFRFNMFWRYGDGLLPFLKKDPAWPHPERAVNRINDRHRRELTDFILSELGERTDLIAQMRAELPALWQAHPARQWLVSDASQTECGTGHHTDPAHHPGRAS